MAGNVSLYWDGESFKGNIQSESGDLVTGDDLSTAVVISLFTWKRAKAGDILPDGTDRKGWWGDTYSSIPEDKIGSRIWILNREKILPSTIARLEEYAYEALEWLIEDKIAKAVTVKAFRNEQDLNRVDMLINIYKADGGSASYAFNNVWEALKR